MTESRDASRDERIGLALSGGGFRAAAYHLGVLKRLEELAVLPKIQALSTVSGGSITGALYAIRCAERGGRPGSYKVDELIGELRPYLTENLRARALFGTPLRALRFLGSVLSTRVSRVSLAIDDLDRELFRAKSLRNLPPWIVINATNLRTGKGWRFMHDRAGDYLVGATERTDSIRIAEAVGASAAYTGLTDSYAFETTWEDMRGDILSENRWERPPSASAGQASRWRQRYGKAAGPVRFPLVDGGLYDNEGVNALRGSRVTHAIISAVSPPESDTMAGFGAARMLRIVEVVHDRLGGATRQLAHEMTHGVHPGEAATRLSELSHALRAVAGKQETPKAIREELELHAEDASALARVGMPPRGSQFKASAQILLHRTDLADNAFAAPTRGALDVPLEHRGLEAAIVAELSRVRTDLDALEAEVFDLLIAQGYFQCDFMIKLAMPEVINSQAAADPYAATIAPGWAFAITTVQRANANRDDVVRRLETSAKRTLPIGRTRSARLGFLARANFALLAIPTLAIMAVVIAWLLYGAWLLGGRLLPLYLLITKISRASEGAIKKICGGCE